MFQIQLKQNCHYSPFLCIIWAGGGCLSGSPARVAEAGHSPEALRPPLASPGPEALVGPSPESQPSSGGALLTLQFQPHRGRLGRALRGAGGRLLTPLDVVPPAQLPHGARLLSCSRRSYDQRTTKPNPRGLPPSVPAGKFPGCALARAETNGAPGGGAGGGATLKARAGRRRRRDQVRGGGGATEGSV